MLFLGLGTGLGSALIIDGELEPMELAHLPTKKTLTKITSGCAGWSGWGKSTLGASRVRGGGEAQSRAGNEYVVLGGGNAKLLKELGANSVKIPMR